MSATNQIQTPRTRLVTPEAIMLIRDRIVRAFHPERIILFGSMARGDVSADSDVDLLIVVPDDTDRRQARRAIGRILCDLTTPVDIVVTTPAEIAEWGHLVGTILRPALREGIVLYDRS
ncbi:MAG: nucleotidyltransferase domain-containing protein [Thermomicrobiales bacterium]